MPNNPQRAALAFAANLDRTLAAGPDYLTEDALHEVGELVGGMSRDGLAADLRAHLDDLQTHHGRDCAAREWLRQAEALMRVAPPMLMAAE